MVSAKEGFILSVISNTIVCQLAFSGVSPRHSKQKMANSFYRPELKRASAADVAANLPLLTEAFAKLSAD